MSAMLLPAHRLQQSCLRLQSQAQKVTIGSHMFANLKTGTKTHNVGMRPKNP